MRRQPRLLPEHPNQLKWAQPSHAGQRLQGHFLGGMGFEESPPRGLPPAPVRSLRATGDRRTSPGRLTPSSYLLTSLRVVERWCCLKVAVRDVELLPSVKDLDIHRALPALLAIASFPF
ncbi:hypothetical protein SAMN00790413_06106 [Deinococcus hopiensis KR-140]|uniref:Uncharacterized protein n=1 Tax=Deinococcus hopiensis KR-140 TaxID=695939 RepID=A0A1W1VWA1_9DEIO|nr:hypothetical protein SAMN00790413_06106 [Deinococcus hopiensis KR-140]